MAETGLSYYYRAGPAALIGKTIGAKFEETAARFPDKTALVSRHQNRRVSFSDLQGRVDDYAAAFLALGLEPGDRIGVWSTNNVEWVICQIATAKVGLILVSINPAYRSGELEYALNKVGCKALVTLDRFRSSDYLAMLNEVAPELADCAPGALEAARVPSLRSVIRLGEETSPGMFNFGELPTRVTPADRAKVAQIAPTLDFDDPINIQFTSGTTGAPKGATLSHHNLINNAQIIAPLIGLTSEDVLCVPVPMYHCFAMVGGSLLMAAHGCTMVFPAEHFDPGATLAAVAEEGCTVLHGVPTMFVAELNHPDFSSFDLSSLRSGLMSGSAIPEALVERVAREMNMRDVITGFGMTELSPGGTMTGPDDSMKVRATTAGRPIPFVEGKIVDPEGHIVPVGTPGEFCARGFNVMKGYWDDPERTAEALDKDGWLHSGDQMVMDGSGYCTVVGRLKDMIIRGGENIFPAEIEAHLHRHASIEDAHVFAVADELMGEEVCAWVKPVQGSNLSEQAIIDHCRATLAHYKVPRYVQLVEEFPLTVSGKVQKFVMRERMEKQLKIRAA